MKTSKTLKVAVFTFFAMLLLLSITVSVATVKAQGNVTVTILSSIGGTSTPAAGTYTNSSGQTQTFSGTPDPGYVLSYWAIVDPSGKTTINNTAIVTLTLTAGTYTLQPVFQALNVPFPVAIPPPNSSSQAVVIVLAAVGGTTSPGPGIYTLANATSLNLVATPLSGWIFDHWVIGGYPLTHGKYNFTDNPTNNPYNVNHGYGYTYSYQPVFSLTTSSSASPTPTVAEFSFAAVIAVVVVLLAALAAVAVYTHGKRK